MPFPQTGEGQRYHGLISRGLHGLGEDMNDRRVAVVVEDDDDVRVLLEGVLSQSGFTVHSGANGNDGVEAVRLHDPSIIILDVGLPDIDGFEVARRVREFSEAHIIMLTARVDEADTVEGFASGADDYLPKPFRSRELRARIGAVLRRAQRAEALKPARDGYTAPGPHGGPETADAAPAPVSTGGSGVYSHHGLVLNALTRTTEIEGRPLELTRTEFDLLQALLSSGKTVRSRAQLVRRLRAEEYDTGSYITETDKHTVDVHIGNLRRKLGEDPRNPRWLKTVRGVGYCLA